MSPKLAEEFLRSGGFLHNTYGDLDDELVSLLEEILTQARLTAVSNKGAVRTMVLTSSEYGKLELAFGPSKFSVVRLEAEHDSERTILSYKYSTKLPEASADPRPNFLAAFQKPHPDVKINRLKGPITFSAIFDEYLSQLTNVRDVETKEALETARKFGYLYPTNTPDIVKSAQTYFGQLSLNVETAGKKYVFHQFPPGNIDFTPLDRFTTKKRDIKGFAVLEVVDPTNTRRVYYVNKEKKRMLIFDDPADFQDHKLDSLVQSLTVISPSGK